MINDTGRIYDGLIFFILSLDKLVDRFITVSFSLNSLMKMKYRKLVLIH
jgi:hypothetical protein